MAVAWTTSRQSDPTKAHRGYGLRSFWTRSTPGDLQLGLTCHRVAVDCTVNRGPKYHAAASDAARARQEPGSVRVRQPAPTGVAFGVGLMVVGGLGRGPSRSCSLGLISALHLLRRARRGASMSVATRVRMLVPAWAALRGLLAPGVRDGRKSGRRRGMERSCWAACGSDAGHPAALARVMVCDRERWNSLGGRPVSSSAGDRAGGEKRAFALCHAPRG